MPRWTDHQRAMLKALGVGAFWPVPAAEASQDKPLPDASPAAVLSRAPVAADRPGPVPVATPSSTRPAPAVPVPVAQVLATALPSQPRPDASGLAWPELAQAIATCQACGLCAQRKQAVVGVGHAQARWMLVGEAPGEQEDLKGEPFVGHAGQLLDRMLQASGLTRADASPEQQVYIANVIKCRPPGNRNPTPEEVQQCEPYLARQVQLVQPRLIVAMGRFAAQALLKSAEPIGRLRGRIHDYQGTPVVVTYHPAYLLRNPADKALAWDDWCLAKEWMAQHG